jgi:3-oxoacyl-[acyl-carrier protein] reductase
MTDRRVCVVTGGAAGLGEAIAARFAAAGHATVLVDRDGDACAATVAKLRAAGGEVAGLTADVSDEAAVTGVAAALRDGYGRVDVLVNNAGYATREGSVVEMSRKAWDLTIAVNLTGPFLMARHLIPLMPPGSVILNIGTIGAIRAVPGSDAYVPRKAA